MNQKNRFQGCLIGLTVGDALGATLEFKRPGTFKRIKDMTVVGCMTPVFGDKTTPPLSFTGEKIANPRPRFRQYPPC